MSYVSAHDMTGVLWCQTVGALSQLSNLTEYVSAHDTTASSITLNGLT
jgi:hypothetical protein